MNQDDLLNLGSRLGGENFAARLRKQVRIMTRFYGGMGSWHWENLDSVMWLIRLAFKMCGLFPRGMTNALNFEVMEQEVPIWKLPEAFRNYRLLHLSDMHIDGHPGLVPALLKSLEPLSFDGCVITGDFRFLVHGSTEKVVQQTEKLLPALQCKDGVFAVLGNHDFIEFVPPLEKAGIRFLLNESIPIARGDSKLWIVGVDDPHFYGTHDLRRAYHSVPATAPSILLSHSPELARVAAESHRPDLFLCGHTHAGQICLPGEKMVLKNAKCPKELLVDAWNIQGMSGYTSRGVGSSGVPLRFNCRPDIVIHELVPALHHRECGDSAGEPFGRKLAEAAS